MLGSSFARLAKFRSGVGLIAVQEPSNGLETEPAVQGDTFGPIGVLSALVGAAMPPSGIVGAMLAGAPPLVAGGQRRGWDITAVGCVICFRALARWITAANGAGRNCRTVLKSRSVAI